MFSILEQLQYGFDRNSRRTWQRRSLTDTQDQRYGYDSLDQVSSAARGSLNVNLTAISGRPASAQSWDYDPTGNWRGYHAAANGTSTLDQHRVHDRGNRLTQIEGNPNNMILDRVGRMRQMAPDASGDWDGKLEITWDAWSRITSVKNNGAVVGDYAYDGTHRRVTRQVDGETLHSYYNDAWRPVEERKGAETTASISYLWGARHRDDLVRRDRAVGGTTLNETRYVLMDYFNPAAITDAAGEVKERYAFSAFGLRTILNPDFTVSSSSECGLEFAFQGQFLDAESGLINYGYRYYSPQLGRWTCKDPIEEEGGANLYAMAFNSAVNMVDYLGLRCICDPKKVDQVIRQYSILAAQKTSIVKDPAWRREWGGVVCCNVKTLQVVAQNPQPGPGPTPVRDRFGGLNGMIAGHVFTPDPTYCRVKGGIDWELAGFYHSHPDNTPLSKDDLLMSAKYEVPNGVGTPNGKTSIGEAVAAGQQGPPHIR